MNPPPTTEAPSRRRRVMRALAGSALVLLGLLAALVLADWLRQPSEPVFQGRRLSEWAKILTAPATPGSEIEREKARAAIASLGTNALPALIIQLQVRDPLTGRLARQSESWLPRRLWIMVMQLARPLDAGERRWAAATALSQLGPLAEPAVPALAGVLQDANPRVVDAATSALGRTGTNGLKALLGVLGSTNEHLASAASYAFYVAGTNAAPLAGDLAEALVRLPSGRRPQALNALSRLGPAMIAPLAAQLPAADAEARGAAVQALQKLADADYANFRALTGLLTNAVPAVREGAALALAQPVPWSRAAVRSLAGALEDPEAGVRRAAFASLTQLADVTDAVTNALPALDRLAESGPAADREALRSLAARIRSLAAQATAR